MSIITFGTAILWSAATCLLTNALWLSTPDERGMCLIFAFVAFLIGCGIGFEA